MASSSFSDVVEADVESVESAVVELLVPVLDVELALDAVDEVDEASLAAASGGGPGGGPDGGAPEASACDVELSDEDELVSLEESDIRNDIRSEANVPVPPLAVDAESAVVEEAEVVSEEEVEEVPLVETLPLLPIQSISDV